MLDLTKRDVSVVDLAPRPHDAHPMAGLLINWHYCARKRGRGKEGTDAVRAMHTYCWRQSLRLHRTRTTPGLVCNGRGSAHWKKDGGRMHVMYSVGRCSMPDACMRVWGTPRAAWHMNVSHVMLLMLGIPVMLTLRKHIITHNKHIIHIKYINTINIINTDINHIRALRLLSVRARYGADLMADVSTDIMHTRIMANNSHYRQIYAGGPTGRRRRGSPGATHVRFQPAPFIQRCRYLRRSAQGPHTAMPGLAVVA